TAFVGIKGMEYNAKFSHRIYPSAGPGPIYEKADIYYAAAVRTRLNDLQTSLQSQDPPSDEQQHRMEVVQSILTNFVEPAEQAAGKNDNPVEADLKLEELA